MRKFVIAARLAPLFCLGATYVATAQTPHHEHSEEMAHTPDVCASAEHDAHGSSKRHFMLLAAEKGVFYDGSGPSVVALMQVDESTGEAQTGAVGFYAEEGEPARFGAVPPRVYDPLLIDRDDPDAVLLRLEISSAQHALALEVLQTWDRRVRERALLYHDDILMNHILFLKQASETLVQCGDALDLYALDWSIEDRISEDNPVYEIPFLFFEEMKRRNEDLHVPDERLPRGVLALLADSSPDE